MTKEEELEYKKKIGNAIERMMKENDLSKYRVIRDAQIPPVTLNNILTGKTDYTHMSLVRVLDYLGKTLIIK